MWIKGYVPCLHIDLSYLKWIQKKGKNPYWIMSTSGVEELIDDFKIYFAPILSSLDDNQGLIDLMIRFRDEQKPQWVLSDAPGKLRNLDEMIAALSEQSKESPDNRGRTTIKCYH